MVFEHARTYPFRRTSFITSYLYISQNRSYYISYIIIITYIILLAPQVLKNNYLMIRIDSYDTDVDGSHWFCYHATSPYIFPAGFCQVDSKFICLFKKKLFTFFLIFIYLKKKWQSLVLLLRHFALHLSRLVLSGRQQIYLSNLFVSSAFCLAGSSNFFLLSLFFYSCALYYLKKVIRQITNLFVNG